MDDLTQYEVTQAPKVVYYMSDFLTQDEESKLWQGVYGAPKPKWTVLSHRRLQNWGGKPHEKGMVPEPMPQWLQELVTTRVSGLGIFGGTDANHVLVNEYCPGQGIMAHEDGPLFHPTVCTVSLGSHTLLNLYSSGHDAPSLSLKDRFLGSLLLEPRSLLILQERAYTSCLHDISSHALLDLVNKDRVLNWRQTALGRQENIFWNIFSSRRENFEDFLQKGEKSSVSKDLPGINDVNLTNQLNTNELAKRERLQISPAYVRLLPDLMSDDLTNKEFLKELTRFCEYVSKKTRKIVVDNSHITPIAAGNTNGKNVMDEDDNECKTSVFENEIDYCSRNLRSNSDFRNGSMETENNIPDNSNQKFASSIEQTSVSSIVITTEDIPVKLQSSESIADLDTGDAPPTASGEALPSSLSVLSGLDGCGTHELNVVVGALEINGNKSFILRRGTRVSLTIRRVPKVLKTKLFLQKKNR